MPDRVFLFDIPRVENLGIWPRGRGEMPRDLARGGRDHGGPKSLGHRYEVSQRVNSCSK